MDTLTGRQEWRISTETVQTEFRSKSLDLVRLTPLMERTEGRPDIKICLIDGPVALEHSELRESNIYELPGRIKASCTRTNTAACRHGTFVAGVLMARRGSVAPAICPKCTLLLRTIFPEEADLGSHLPRATPQDLAVAVIDAVEAGCHVLNMSVGLSRFSSEGTEKLREAFDYAASREMLCVAAAGNQAAVGSTAITSHPWVIPVVGCDIRGRPTNESNLGNSIGCRGLRAPGRDVTSLGSDSTPVVFSGTSVAAPFVTGTIALLLSQFPTVNGGAVKKSLRRSIFARRTIVPPMLDSWGAHQILSSLQQNMDSGS
jgi:subtilisin family serine protease